MKSPSSTLFEHLESHTVAELLRQFGANPVERPLALNGVENRVFSCKARELGSFVLKFYRPGRWSEAVIREEINLVQMLSEAGQRVPSPLTLCERLLNSWHGVSCAAFSVVPPPARSRPTLSPEEILRIGEAISELHSMTSSYAVRHRAHFTPLDLISASTSSLTETLRKGPSGRVLSCAGLLKASFEGYASVPRQVIHGDLGSWNILWSAGDPWIIDFDDMCVGSAVQELLAFADSVKSPHMEEREIWEPLLIGYSKGRVFSSDWLRFRKPLRALHQLLLMSWSVARSTDPRFVHFEPRYGSLQYWDSQLDRLEHLAKAAAASVVH